MTTVVISQPMLFPWVGLFEQIRLADIYVHYTDVQFSKGSFSNRVQIKCADGSKWLTVPVSKHRLGASIGAIQVAAPDSWKARHLAFLRQAFAPAPHGRDALTLVESVYATASQSLCELTIASMDAVLDYFGLKRGRRFLLSPSLNVGGDGSQRVLEIVKSLGGDVYVTGHGARDYLVHEAFRDAAIRVQYMDYRKTPYAQLYGPFTPYVSILDLIANHGHDGLALINSGTLPWNEFLS
jgi:hypothetical protein